MIVLKELINRQYDEDNHVKSWRYILKDIDLGKEKVNINFDFEKLSDKRYKVTTIIGLTDYTNTVYTQVYDTPKSNMDLCLITAMGLINIQYYIKDEVQMKTLIDFSLGEAIKGM